MKTKFISLMFLCIAFLCSAEPVYTLNEQWVDCGNGVKLIDPYYPDGVTFEWTGSSKKGKAHGAGIARKYKNARWSLLMKALTKMESEKAKEN